MAHKNFDLPIFVTYQSAPLRWEKCTVALSRKRSDIHPKHPLDLGASLVPPDQLHVQLLRRPGSHPRSKEIAETWFSVSDSGVELELRRELEIALGPLAGPLPEVLVAFDPNLPTAKAKECDAWQMRSEFMNLDESDTALLSFLNRWGDWGGTRLFEVWGGRLGDVGRFSLDQAPACVFPPQVWKLRQIYKSALLGSAEEWLSKSVGLRYLSRRSQFPYMGLTDRSCISAIETTITLDHLRNFKSRICAREDCDNVFTVESNHGQIYCQQYCGHVVSQRNKRAAAKASREVKKARSV